MVASMALSGCGRRSGFDRTTASQTDGSTADVQTRQTAPPIEGSDAQTDPMLEELETALDELETTIAEADQDALSDLALAVFGT